MTELQLSKERTMSELVLNFVKIPASEFTMGSKRSMDRETHEDETPAHVLSVSDYFIMKYPVTNEQYNQFVQATGCRTTLSDNRPANEGSGSCQRADH